MEYTEGNCSFLYSCKFAKFGKEKDKDLFGITGSNENFFGCYDLMSDKLRTNMVSRNNLKSVYAIDFSYKDREFAVASGEGKIHLVSYKQK